MGEVKELVVKCQRCKREIPDGGMYYLHEKYGVVCEYCPEFEDGGVHIQDGEE